ncbi:MAG: alkaline phosphatase family protein, partial [Acidithiobacillus ferriphilus]
MGPQNRRQFLTQLGLGSSAVIAAPHLLGVARAAGISEENLLRQKVEHVVVIFQENRSFDHYFGTFQPKNGQQI